MDPVSGISGDSSWIHIPCLQFDIGSAGASRPGLLCSCADSSAVDSTGE